MKKFYLKDFSRGWIAGDFHPSILRSKEFEFMVRNYKKGDKENRHVHKVAHEISVVVTGKFRMSEHILGPGDIIYLEPGTPTDFECLEDGSTAVVKSPSVIGDKYYL